MGLVFLDGEYLDFAQAKVSVEDRGYQFGDGIYEVVRCYRGIPFQLGAHLERLEKSARAIELDLPYSREEMEEITSELLARSGIQEAQLYIQVTRGTAPRSHFWPEGIKPVVVMYVREAAPPEEGLRRSGVKVITVVDDRWKRCNVKSLNLLPNVLAKNRARQAGAFEAVFYEEESRLVNEGSSSNVFALVADTLVTPDLGHNILPGITRKVVLDIARQKGLPVKEDRLSLDDLYRAQEVFITSTVVEIMPVVMVDELPVADGKPGPVTRMLYEAYREEVEEAIKKAR
ncbi:D-amino-acid transaminase [Calderihabitans maritimus]|uniref:D-alanine aminotransferase n=1 Tax=Calderihabitans maritimus TaxID=1246530 RepID=A0A1Z5HPP9_9FIRM|nr:D-amino-acid transaminase [Calderihabitans maritimus]GAW91301.1 D-amino acid aminotransferase [Calderihabitans maritimus]